MVEWGGEYNATLGEYVETPLRGSKQKIFSHVCAAGKPCKHLVKGPLSFAQLYRQLSFHPRLLLLQGSLTRRAMIFLRPSKLPEAFK